MVISSKQEQAGFETGAAGWKLPALPRAFEQTLPGLNSCQNSFRWTMVEKGPTLARNVLLLARPNNS